jgi:hypothetical protein
MSRHSQIKRLLSLIGIVLHNREDITFQQFFTWANTTIEASPGWEDLSDTQVISALQAEYLNKFRKGDRDASLGSSVVVSNESSSI